MRRSSSRSDVRLVRVEIGSARRYGALEGSTIALFDRSPFGGGSPSGESVTLDDCRLLPPVEPTKIIAIGRNYAAHAEEMGLTLGAVPSVFIKPLQTLVGHGDDVVLPPRRLSTEVEHEGELAVVIGRRARNVSPSELADVVFGLTCANDVSARDIQRSDPQLTRGKGFDTFCPLGPHVLTDVPLDEHLEVTCTVNGELRQRGSTRDLIFDIPTLVAHLSEWTTLMPGDVILTGSPAGTGPLRPGDRVEVEVAGVGVLEHGVEVAEEDRL